MAMLGDDRVQSLWALDQLAGRSPTMEAMTSLAYVAALTTQQRLGVAVLVGAGRGPIVAAKAITTLDRMSGGRIDIGLGLGAGAHYSSYGVDRVAGGGSGAMLDEFVEIVRRLWSEEAVTVDGATWQLHDVQMTPKPVQQPHPPLWIGGGSRRALERVLDLGGRWIGAGRHSTAEFTTLARELKVVAEERAWAGELRIAKRIYLMIDDDRATCERTVGEWFGRFYRRPELGLEVSVLGSIDECTDQLAAVVEAGATELIVHPLVDGPEQYQLVIDEIITRL